MSRTTPLRRHLIADQVLVILLLAAGILGATFLGARRAIESLSRTIVVRAANEVESQLHRFFEPVAGGLETLGEWGAAGLFTDLTLERRRDLLRPLIARLPQVSSVVLADREGRSRWLEWGAESGETPRELASDARPQSWYAEALDAAEDARSHWTEPRVLATTGQPGLTASLAFESTDGFEQVVAFEVHLDDLERYAREIEVSENGSLWLLTGDRRLLAGPEVLDRGRAPGILLLRSPGELGLPVLDAAAEAFADAYKPR